MLARSSKSNNSKKISKFDSESKHKTNKLYERNTVPPYIAGFKNYAVFRIPTLLVSKKWIYSFAQGRMDTHHDFEGPQHIVFRRSKSRGHKWKPMQVLTKGEPGFICGSMSPVLLNKKTILLMWVEQHDTQDGAESKTTRVFTIKSNDAGKTWTEKKDVTYQVRRKYDRPGKWFGVGPSSGIVKKHSPNKGRIIIVASQSGIEIGSKHKQFSPSHLIFSDDDGESWNVGATMQVKSKEATVVELANGDLMINARSNDYPHRIVGLSVDGGISFKVDGDDLRIDDVTSKNPGKLLSDCGERFTDCGVHSGLVLHSKNESSGLSNLIFSNPQGTRVERTYGTLQYSENSGETWTSKLRYTDDSVGNKHGYSGYSNLALLDDGASIAILFERGGTNPAEYVEGRALIENETWQINFNTFNAEGKPKGLTSRKRKSKRRHHMIDFKIIPFSAFTDDAIKESVQEPEGNNLKQCVKIDSSMGKIKDNECH
tara:strand:- start:2449 stop:3903 length:1455 start_codon:yes stop_codon:yes gene_type:complete